MAAAFGSVNAASNVSLALSESVLNEVLFDVSTIATRAAAEVATMPLWSTGPELGAWTAVKAALSTGGDWDVWIDWYEERLHGTVLAGEDYEIVFRRAYHKKGMGQGAGGGECVDQGALAEGPREHAAATGPLPRPLADLDSPFTYDWNASWRVAIVAGAQNLPFFRFGSSEEDHRQTLEACRIGAERLLKDLLEASYGNAVRSEYSKRLEYYLDDLPGAAGAGNILLANDQIVVLRAMLAPKMNAVPFPLAADLNRLIANQPALLNDFYDLVRRHEEAVAKGQWTQPFPIEEAKRFFGVVEENTPQLFEPEVGSGLRQVERAAPPAPTTTAPPLPSAIQPPPLPPGTPNAEHSQQRQIATAANALWAVFLKGKDLPVAIEGWTQAAHRLGENIGPILNFLRSLSPPS